MRRTPFSFVLFLWLLSACATPTPDLPVPIYKPVSIAAPTATMMNFPLGATVTARPIKPARTPAPFLPTSPAQASDVPTPPFPMAVSPDGSEVQCFKGPGTEYEPIYKFKASEIVGVDETGQWWYVQFYDKQTKPLWCWVNSSQTLQLGNLNDISVAEAEKASVTAVKIVFNEGDTQVVACDQSGIRPEFHFSGKIVTSGPVEKLSYQWLTDAEMKFPQEQVQVQAWDSPAWVNLNLLAPAQEGIYSLTLRTIYPNEMVTIVQFRVKCQ